MSSEGDPRVRVAVAVPVEADEAELVADLLFGAGASAVLERSTDDGRLELIADLDPATLTALGRPGRVLDAAPGSAPEVEAAPRSATYRCGRSLVVTAVGGPGDPMPGAQAVGPSDEVRLLVDPGQAFGSGSHASTRLCLAALEPLAAGADTVLDVGCGTGVLGVAAALIGPGTVRAIDVDPEAVRVSELVASLNGVQDRFEVDATPLEQLEGSFDLVMANLLVPIVEQLGEDLVRVLAPDGSLVVGGLLLAHRDRAIAALAPLVLQQSYVEGDWVALVLANR